MDWPAALAWNSRPDSRGMGGRFGLEWVADFSGIHMKTIKVLNEAQAITDLERITGLSFS
jgi:hypothetical protein